MPACDQQDGKRRAQLIGLRNGTCSHIERPCMKHEHAAVPAQVQHARLQERVITPDSWTHSLDATRHSMIQLPTTRDIAHVA